MSNSLGHRHLSRGPKFYWLGDGAFIEPQTACSALEVHSYVRNFASWNQ